ncbi:MULTISPECIES: ABC transporter substrate-binding protein [unclassified Pseudodesulfovibrio]|uniref:substrate-binding periplasmic protein n=1 Tax=unclassified Pseudodesulfovibrio TaxID=2661612 RepID=UPI0013E3094C|nr:MULTISPECIES: ABC transporter substrate-binding protein [unclassified Pseudodesulfovibrio]MCJ2165765.1 ABC transporter substrate-binding protein [Pseudodesulfovibrio sp. S3-i]
MKQRLLIPSIILAMAVQTMALLAAPCAARDEADNSTPEKELDMFIAHADVSPYYMEVPEFQGRGILLDVLKALVEPLNYTVTVNRLPDKRGWQMLENGELSVYASAREWVAQPDKFLWTDPFMLNEDVLLFRADSILEYTKPEDLYGKTVAGIKDFVYPALEPHFGPGMITRLDTTSPDVMLKLLSFGRADAVLVNHTEILWMFRNRPEIRPELFRLEKPPFDRAWFRFLFPKGHGWEPVVEQINHRLKVMKEDGSLKAILDQYR